MSECTQAIRLNAPKSQHHCSGRGYYYITSISQKLLQSNSLAKHTSSHDRLTLSQIHAVLLANGTGSSLLLIIDFSHCLPWEGTHYLDRLNFLHSVLDMVRTEIWEGVWTAKGFPCRSNIFWDPTKAHIGGLVQALPLEPCSLLFSSIYHLFNLSWAVATCK